MSELNPFGAFGKFSLLGTLLGNGLSYHNDNRSAGVLESVVDGTFGKGSTAKATAGIASYMGHVIKTDPFINLAINDKISKGEIDADPIPLDYGIDRVVSASNSVAPNATQPVVLPQGGSSASQSVDYLNADLAKAYGMDASTAYQEALSNTSYQRAVEDLKAAGLNPVLAAGSLSPSGGVYNASVAGSGLQMSGGASTAHSMYKSLSNLGTIAGAGIGWMISGAHGAVVGSSLGNKLLGSIGNILDS